jgi:hypothetical protein
MRDQPELRLAPDRGLSCYRIVSSRKIAFDAAMTLP